MKKVVEVVLTENIQKVGLKGDSKKLTKGYVKNYLLPEKLVVLSSDPRARQIIKDLQKERAKLDSEIAKIRQLAKKIEIEPIKISAKVGKSGTLYGSVDSEDIAKVLKLDKKNIKMPPIKEIGIHQVKISLGYEIFANAKVIIEATSGVLAKKSKKSRGKNSFVEK